MTKKEKIERDNMMIPKQIDKGRESMIQIRGGFSEQMGIYHCNTEMQINDLDDRTRTLLNNKLFDILSVFFDKTDPFDYSPECLDRSNAFCKSVITNVFIERTALGLGSKYDWRAVYENRINRVISNAPFNEVFDLLVYICDWLKDNCAKKSDMTYIYDVFNKLFEKEYVGYHFIEGLIVPITDEIEVKEIEDAFTIKYKGAKAHIEKALAFLSDREKPDYKNSIKESISAVESICKIIVGNDHATLGDALKILEKKNGLKGQLKSGFEKLYNYTNDKGGIRHAEGMFESNVTFEEAKFMLVSCCAFVNYLLAEYGK